MGRYIQGSPFGKAEFLKKEHGAKQVSQQEAEQAVLDGEGVVCVVDNGRFEAAGYVYDENEYNAFSCPGDFRPKTWLVMSKDIVEKLAN